MLTFASRSLQLHCTCITYADFRVNIASNPHLLRTQTPSVAVWAKPTWIIQQIRRAVLAHLLHVLGDTVWNHSVWSHLYIYYMYSSSKALCWQQASAKALDSCTKSCFRKTSCRRETHTFDGTCMFYSTPMGAAPLPPYLHWGTGLAGALLRTFAILTYLLLPKQCWKTTSNKTKTNPPKWTPEGAPGEDCLDVCYIVAIC